MNGFENRQRTPDWRFVALKTKRGRSGRSCSVASPKRCRAYEPASRSPMLPGRSAPRRTTGMSTVRPASPRTGSTIAATNARATPCSSRSSRDQPCPSAPAVIEPPETLETRSRRGRKPSSFRRQSAPRWKSIARYPPPERQRARPGWTLRPSPMSRTGLAASAIAVWGVAGAASGSDTRIVLPTGPAQFWARPRGGCFGDHVPPDDGPDDQAAPAGCQGDGSALGVVVREAAGAERRVDACADPLLERGRARDEILDVGVLVRDARRQGLELLERALEPLRDLLLDARSESLAEVVEAPLDLLLR